MAEQVLSVPRRESSVLRMLKGMALIRESVVGMIGLALVVIWVFAALFADVIAPFPPNATILPMAVPGTAGPDGGVFWLGTDHIGRDILSRIIYGSRRVLIFAPLATFFAYAVGIPMGLAAGYRRGMIDEILSFIANIILSFPVLVLYVVIIATVGASAINIMVAVTFASAPEFSASSGGLRWICATASTFSRRRRGARRRGAS